MQRDEVEALAGEIHSAIGYSHICGRMDRYGVEDRHDRSMIQYNWSTAATKAFIAGRGVSLDDDQFSALRAMVEALDLAHYEKIKAEYEDDEYYSDDEY